MSNILQARVEVVGTRAFLMHAFGRESIPLEKREKSGVAGNDPEEWRRSVLFTKTGELWIPPTYVFGCLSNGSKYTKKGKGSIQAVFTSTLTVLDEKIFFGLSIPGFNGHLPDTLPEDDTLPVYLDVRSSINPTTRGRKVVYRVALKAGWQVTFNIAWDKTIISRGEMEAVCIDAGKLCGLGSGRKIGFGRFDVESFEVQD